MTLREFERGYCLLCGSQHCGGITDKEWREGCPYYIEEYQKSILRGEMCEAD